MKAYKIDLSGFTGKVREVVSEAVQKKAFEMGYAWRAKDRSCIHTDAGSLYFWENSDIGHMEDTENGRTYYAQNGHGYVPITAADFLALETAKEPEFKAFDKVLVRDLDSQKWDIDFFVDPYEHREEYKFKGFRAVWKQCIPYEGNEHLIGTTDSQK